MKYKMSRSEFDECLAGEGYSLYELSHLFRVVCEMDSRVRRWTLRWLLGMGFPKESIEGVTVPMLVAEGYKPMNAFIIMDWLIKDPEAARFSLTRHAQAFEVDEKTAEELRSIARSEGLMVQEVSDEDLNGETQSSVEC